MAIKIYITGNFLVAEDTDSRTQYFKVNTRGVHHKRSADDDFAFFQEGLFPQVSNEQPQYLQLGVQRAWEWNTTELENKSQTSFAFSEIRDKNGEPYFDSDTFDQYLNDNLGKTEVVVTGGGVPYLTYVATDETLTGDGTFDNPLSVVPLIERYEEKFDPFLALINASWHNIIVPSAPINRVISVLISVNSPNITAGVRQVGSGFNRYGLIDGDGNITMNVKTNALGQIEVFTSNLASTTFTVLSYIL